MSFTCSLLSICMISQEQEASPVAKEARKFPDSFCYLQIPAAWFPRGRCGRESSRGRKVNYVAWVSYSLSGPLLTSSTHNEKFCLNGRYPLVNCHIYSPNFLKCVLHWELSFSCQVTFFSFPFKSPFHLSIAPVAWDDPGHERSSECPRELPTAGYFLLQRWHRCLIGCSWEIWICSTVI